MIRRKIALGPKHHTPTYFVNDIPLDCIDMTAYILTHGYDNEYGHLIRRGTSYPESLEKEYFITAIRAGRRLSPKITEGELNDTLIEILREFYPKRLDELIANRNNIIRWYLSSAYSLKWAERKAAADRANSPISDEEMRRLLR